MLFYFHSETQPVRLHWIPFFVLLENSVFLEVLFKFSCSSRAILRRNNLYSEHFLVEAEIELQWSYHPLVEGDSDLSVSRDWTNLHLGMGPLFLLFIEVD